MRFLALIFIGSASLVCGNEAPIGADMTYNFPMRFRATDELCDKLHEQAFGNRIEILLLPGKRVVDRFKVEPEQICEGAGQVNWVFFGRFERSDEGEALLLEVAIDINGLRLQSITIDARDQLRGQEEILVVFEE